jgi:hypothetical protein
MFFAIRHKASGGYLPCTDEYGHYRKRGFTHLEPSAVDQPRMFKSQATAERALRAWVAGKWNRGEKAQPQAAPFSFSSSALTLRPPKTTGVYVERVAGRYLIDFEVVQLEINPQRI